MVSEPHAISCNAISTLWSLTLFVVNRCFGGCQPSLLTFFDDTLKYCKLHHGRLFNTWERHVFPQAEPIGGDAGGPAGALSMCRYGMAWALLHDNTC